jgi:hypothetical protein
MKKVSIILLLALAFISCNESTSDCQNKVCTALFSSVNVKFIDTNGAPLIVNDYQSISLRTNKSLSSAGAVDPINFKGFYTVVDESELNELNTAERILVSAKHPTTNVLKQAEFTVSGGECACDVVKTAGPEEVRF